MLFNTFGTKSDAFEEMLFTNISFPTCSNLHDLSKV